MHAGEEGKMCEVKRAAEGQPDVSTVPTDVTPKDDSQEVSKGGRTEAAGPTEYEMMTTQEMAEEQLIK